MPQSGPFFSAADHILYNFAKKQASHIHAESSLSPFGRGEGGCVRQRGGFLESEPETKLRLRLKEPGETGSNERGTADILPRQRTEATAQPPPKGDSPARVFFPEIQKAESQSAERQRNRKVRRNKPKHHHQTVMAALINVSVAESELAAISFFRGWRKTQVMSK